MTNKERKQRYFDRVYAEAPWVPCACGCDRMIKNKDRYGRDKRYIAGHNTPRKYHATKEYKRAWERRNRPARYAYKKQRGQKRKGKLLRHMGGKCVGCGLEYDGTNAPVFDIHHRDPEEKVTQLNQCRINDMSWDDVLTEAAKCDMICSIVTE